jgi:RNA polymerase-binding transcription factor DksA
VRVASPSSSTPRRELDAGDATSARSAAGTRDCETCGERIPAEERASAPLAQRCLRCSEGMAHARLAGRSPYCNLK